MTSGPTVYRLPQANWALEFGASALETLQEHVQASSRSKESVGQLYSGDLTSDRLVVDVATVLKPTWAAWAKVRFDTKQAMAEREVLFGRGLHCIGLWHTHPEANPTPSPEDRILALDHALAAVPQLSGLVFAIVGTLPMPAALRVWVHDGQELRASEVVSEPMCKAN
jgi:proteasome lid subunit RPN8/RPN11